MLGSDMVAQFIPWPTHLNGSSVLSDSSQMLAILSLLPWGFSLGCALTKYPLLLTVIQRSSFTDLR